MSTKRQTVVVKIISITLLMLGVFIVGISLNSHAIGVAGDFVNFLMSFLSKRKLCTEYPREFFCSEKVLIYSFYFLIFVPISLGFFLAKKTLPSALTASLGLGVITGVTFWILVT